MLGTFSLASSLEYSSSYHNPFLLEVTLKGFIEMEIQIKIWYFIEKTLWKTQSTWDYCSWCRSVCPYHSILIFESGLFAYFLNQFINIIVIAVQAPENLFDHSASDILNKLNLFWCRQFETSLLLLENIFLWWWSLVRSIQRFSTVCKQKKLHFPEVEYWTVRYTKAATET